MTTQIGRNRNTNDTATVTTGFTLNSTTSTVISAANINRLMFHVNSDFSDKACWIRLYASSDDNLKRGVFLHEKEKGVTHWDMPIDNIYTGEISAIAEEGAPIVYVTEY